VQEFSPIDLSAKLHSCYAVCVAGPDWVESERQGQLVSLKVTLGFSPNQINHSGRRSVYTDYLPVRAVDICVPGTTPGGRRATAPNACGGGALDYAPGYECAVWQSRSAGALAGSVPVACRPPRVPRDAVSPRCCGYFTETPPEGPNTRPGRRPDDKRWGNGGALPAYTHQGLSEAVSAAVHPPCEP